MNTIYGDRNAGHRHVFRRRIERVKNKLRHEEDGDGRDCGAPRRARSSCSCNKIRKSRAWRESRLEFHKRAAGKACQSAEGQLTVSPAACLVLALIGLAEVADLEAFGKRRFRRDGAQTRGEAEARLAPGKSVSALSEK